MRQASDVHADAKTETGRTGRTGDDTAQGREDVHPRDDRRAPERRADNEDPTGKLRGGAARRGRLRSRRPWRNCSEAGPRPTMGALKRGREDGGREERMGGR